MGIIGIRKTKHGRTKKSLKERIDALADKFLFELINDDPEMLRQYVNKREGLNIPSESERKLNRVVEDTKLKIYDKIAADLPYDPEATEAIRDKFMADLGLPVYAPRGRGNGGSTQRPSFQSQMEKLERDIAHINKIKEILGAKEGGWTKLLQNPEVIKAFSDTLKSIVGSFGSSPQINPDDNTIVFVEINGEMKEMPYSAYMQHKQNREITLQKADSIPSSQGNQDIKTNSIADGTSSLSAFSTPSIQPNLEEEFWIHLKYILAVMDQPAIEFSKKTTESIQSGDKVAVQIREFVVANSYENVVKQLSGYGDYLKKFEDHKDWYRQAVEAFRAQM